jgi:hypothetical protein
VLRPKFYCGESDYGSRPIPEAPISTILLLLPKERLITIITSMARWQGPNWAWFWIFVGLTNYQKDNNSRAFFINLPQKNG